MEIVTTENNQPDRAPADKKPAPFSVTVTLDLSEARELHHLAKERISFAYVKGRNAFERREAARRAMRSLDKAIKAAEGRL